MPTLSNSQAQYFQLLRTLVPNPGGKHITPQMETDAMNAGALAISAKLGGLWFLDTSLLTTADVSDYTVPNHIHNITYAEIVDTSVTPNTFEFFDVVPYKLFRRLNTPTATSNKFAYFWPEQHQLHIEPAPETTGFTLRLLCWGMPNVMVPGSAVLYDGAVEQMTAVVLEAASLLRLGVSRDPQEAAALHARAQEATHDATDTQSMRRQVTRVQVGKQVPLNRLRRI